MKLFKKLSISVAMLLSCMGAEAVPTMLSAKLDSASMLMGTVNTLRLEVVQDKGKVGEFPLFRNIDRRGYATLLGDTIELSSKVKVDTTDIGSNRLQINWAVPIQVFDSGYYRLPEFVYVEGRDTVRSKSLVLTVRPVKVTAEDQISPLTEPADPENPSIFDALPDWLVNYWWVILLILAICGAGWWAWRRYRKEGHILPAKPEPPADVVALESLRRLKSLHLCESGREKEYYTRLTEILRVYLDRRFGIKAMEMTTRQIMDCLADDPAMRDSRQMMRQILDMADFVKFAMVRPLPDDNVRAYNNAVEFVEATRPRPEATPEPEDVVTDKNKEKTEINPEKKKGGKS